MLDDPSLSRQWVARRLQRALTVERWGAPARAGLAHIGGTPGHLLAEQADASRRRADHLETLIHEIGAEPYPSSGIGAPVARTVTRLLATVSARLGERLAHNLAEHTLSEYQSLEGFVQDAAGVPRDLHRRITPLHQEVAHELERLARRHRSPR